MTTHAGIIVRDARTTAGLSRRALAAKAEVPTSTVSRIEDGLVDPSITMLGRLIEAAGARLLLSAQQIDAGPTLASLSNAVEEIGGRLKIDWTRLRGFADWAALHPRDLPAAIADPPLRTDTPLDAILAAFAEQLADAFGIGRPRWCRTVGALDEEWSAPGTPRMQAEARAQTTEPFRRRNLVIPESALFREAA